jgi:molybdopterin biosynthesis enzyme MoaB
MEGPGALKAAIIIVSTTAAKNPSTDASADVLRKVFEDQGPGSWELVDTTIVSDDVLAIQRQIMYFADSPDPVNLIITTGGTGFAVADETPEVAPLNSLKIQFIYLLTMIQGSRTPASQTGARPSPRHVGRISCRYAV